jgi:CDP-diacylglycerol--glycerol-3-phosphate 3-phosphatidyltransferase
MWRWINVPNFLTVSRILLTPIFLVLVFAERWYCQNLALLVFILAALTDLYDGRLARKEGAVTAVGRFLDPLADKVLVSSALISFAILGMIEIWLVAAILVRDIVITILRMYAIYRNRQVVTSTLAKWKTTIQVVTILVILAFMNLKAILVELGSATTFLDGQWSYWFFNGLIGTAMLLTLISGVRYLFDRNKYRL